MAKLIFVAKFRFFFLDPTIEMFGSLGGSIALTRLMEIILQDLIFVNKFLWQSEFSAGGAGSNVNILPRELPGGRTY